VQAGLVLIVLQLGYRAWSLYGAWFHIDDFNFVSRMTNQGLSLGTASQSYFGHVMPAGMYLSWLNDQIAPWNWNLPATELLLMQALADVGLLALLVRLFSARWGVLAPLSVYLFSAITMPVAIWWAAAINQIPLMISLFFAMGSHLAYLRSRRLRHAAFAALWIIVGLAFNEKTILVFGALVIFTLCYFASGSIGHRVATVWRTYRRGFVLYAAIGLLYVACYLKVGLEFSPGKRIDYPILPVTGNMTLRAYTPGVVGGPLQWWKIPDQPGSIPLPSDLIVVVSLVVLGLLLRELYLTRVGWARAALLPAFFLAADIALVVAGRASYVGALISLDYRYQGELSAVTAIALGCALFPILGAVESVRTRASSELFDHPRRATAVVLAISVLGVYSSTVYAVHWQADHQSERFVLRSTTALAKAPAPIPLVDLPVPPTITNGLRFPENLYSHVFRSTQGQAVYPDVATDRLFAVTGTGHVEPVGIPPVRSAAPGPVKGCGYRIGAKDTDIELDGPLAYGGWWVRIGYIATAQSPVRITTGKLTRQANLQPGVHALFVRAAGSFDSVKISGLQGDARMCTSDITVGRPEPVEAQQ